MRFSTPVSFIDPLFQSLPQLALTGLFWHPLFGWFGALHLLHRFPNGRLDPLAIALWVLALTWHLKIPFLRGRGVLSK